jgi:P4 family phage/plasmid primase-like protien
VAAVAEELLATIDPGSPRLSRGQLDVGVDPAVFFDSSGLVVPELAKAVGEGSALRLGVDGRIYHYRSGVYRPDGDTLVRARVRELLGQRFRKRHMEEVLSYLRAAFPDIGQQSPAGLLNLHSGLLNLNTKEISDHSPDLLSTVQLPVDWNPKATCPRIDRFLWEVIPPDALDLVLEVIGYATYPANPYRVAVLLLGPGRNGKSILLRVLAALLGPENVSAMPLQVLAENRFASAELLGKLANIGGDLDAREVRRSDQFKIITGGDVIYAERKFGHPFQFTPFALPIFSANEAPISSDQTDAWFDRWLIIPMERRFTEDEADPFLAAKLTTSAELSGLLVRAVDALQRLMARGRFERPESVSKAGDLYRDKLDTVRGFVAEACVIGPSYWTPRPAVYAAYRGWCRGSGRLPVSAEHFNDHLRSNYPMRVSESTRRGNRGWQGLALMSDRSEP